METNFGLVGYGPCCKINIITVPAGPQSPYGGLETAGISNGKAHDSLFLSHRELPPAATSRTTTTRPFLMYLV